ncbi:hypothetical protein SEPCBS119000_003932 [Sporothrix epigloea]|uniref:C2H2-type domain-containing protein n=1 Tax=Sporothrix epigloea TaxID=1892477 RepID=A0ABP0DQN8_9PEZI
MAMDAPGAVSGLPSSKISAARQHVQTLSIVDREALLCALLEQQDRPPAATASAVDPPTSTPASSRLSAPPSSASISALTISLFDCPPLREEAHETEASASSSPSPQQHTRSSTSSSAAALSSEFSALSTSTTTSSHSTAPSPTLSARVRSQSLLSSPQLLRSAFSSYHPEKTSLRSRSQSFQPTPSATFPAFTASTTNVPQLRPPSSETRTLSKPTLAIDLAAAASLSTVTAAPPQQESGDAPDPAAKQHTYWCTACGKNSHDRARWARHDVACRGNERCLARDGQSSKSGSSRHIGRPQRAWGCGFCAAFLGSLERYQAHVAGHFERGCTLAHWLFANVIYGLLHQRAVHKHWKQLWEARVAALPSHLRPKATWSPGCSLAVGEAEGARQMPLREALEVFDACFDSATALARQADALAIFIAVPVDDDAQRPRQTAIAAEARELPVESTEHVPQPASPPSPAASVAKLLPSAIPAPSPPASVVAASAKSVSPVAVAKAHDKIDKPASKLSSRRPSFLFRSKALLSLSSSGSESTAGTSSIADKEPAQRPENRKLSFSGTKLSRTRAAAPIPQSSAASISSAYSAPPPVKTAATAGARASTRIASSHHDHWADRPLPPPVKSSFGLAATPSPLTAHPVHMRPASGAAYGQRHQPAPPPKPGLLSEATGNWKSAATSSVQDIVVPANA